MHAELEGKALDAAVALALGYENPGAVGKFEPTTDGTPWCRSGCNDWWFHKKGGWVCGPCCNLPKQYSSDWGVAGPIIDREQIDIKHYGREVMPSLWEAAAEVYGGYRSYGHTALIAAMRAYVRSKTPNVQANRPIAAGWYLG